MADLKGFSGVSFPFRLTPDFTGGVVTSTTTRDDPRHIDESIQQIIGTALGERWMVHNFGVGLDRMLGRGMDDALAAGLEVSLREQLMRWERRCDFPLVRVTADQRNGTLYITVHRVVRQTLVRGQVTLEVPSVAA